MKKLGTTISELYRKVFKSDFMRLIAAIRKGQLDKVKEYHKKGINFSQYMETGDTPLHVATAHSHLQIIQYICQKVQKVNINDKNFAGDTALLLACINGDQEIVRYLIEKGAMANIKENRGYTPIMAACANGHLKIVKYLIERTDANTKTRTIDGQTALHRAAYYGEAEVVRFLTRNLRMNTRAADIKGNLPIHYASIKLNITCVRFLAQEGERNVVECLNIKNKDGSSSLDLLQKILNKLREINEPEFNQEDILHYIVNKHRIPHRKIYQHLLAAKEPTNAQRQDTLYKPESALRLNEEPESAQESDRTLSKLSLRQKIPPHLISRPVKDSNMYLSPMNNTKISEKADDESFSQSSDNPDSNTVTPINKMTRARDAFMENIKHNGIKIAAKRSGSISNGLELSSSSSINRTTKNTERTFLRQGTPNEPITPAMRRSPFLKNRRHSLRSQHPPNPLGISQDKEEKNVPKSATFKKPIAIDPKGKSRFFKEQQQQYL